MEVNDELGQKIFESDMATHWTKDALLFVAQHGNEVEVAQIARAKLAEMGIEIPEVEEVGDSPIIQTAKPQSRNIVSYILLLLMAVGIWMYVMRGR